MQKRLDFRELARRLKQDKGRKTQQDYAKQLRVDQATLSRLLSGQQSRLSGKVLGRLRERVTIPEVAVMEDEERALADKQLVEQAIARVGGKAVVLCARLYFGASSVSEWRKGVRRIPQNERRRLEEFVNAPAVESTGCVEDPIEVFAAGYVLNPELARLRQLRPDLVMQEWDPVFQAALNQARRERDEIMLRTIRTLDDRLRILLKLAQRR